MTSATIKIAGAKKTDIRTVQKVACQLLRDPGFASLPTESQNRRLASSVEPRLQTIALQIFRD
ncbi:hypothetical protein [Kordiimonas sp.]|uniref:hypothetical protein n=1 Tax=Kordiimonas sp. TaxID=1970157 RepID=UPI003A8D1B0F